MTVYADNAATTRMSRTALDAMLPAMEENYGNPSSLHSVGQRAAELLMKSRETVARCLNCQPREIIFTSGGSEADNQAPAFCRCHRPPQRARCTSSPPPSSTTPFSTP